MEGFLFGFLVYSSNFSTRSMTAIIKSKWINPPNTTPLKKPRAQRITKTMIIGTIYKMLRLIKNATTRYVLISLKT